MATTFTAVESQQVHANPALLHSQVPEAQPVIQLDHIHKTYTMGDVEVHALAWSLVDDSRR